MNLRLFWILLLLMHSVLSKLLIFKYNVSCESTICVKYFRTGSSWMLPLNIINSLLCRRTISYVSACETTNHFSMVTERITRSITFLKPLLPHTVYNHNYESCFSRWYVWQAHLWQVASAANLRTSDAGSGDVILLLIRFNVCILMRDRRRFSELQSCNSSWDVSNPRDSLGAAYEWLQASRRALLIHTAHVPRTPVRLGVKY